ncbi:MAG: recombinase family protein, partial [Romboutsia sp.]|uniref:recombinase family protein n=1 Tax=Romboutsia sp. TaxID=1965302 RepID=UPI003F344B8D
MITNNKEIKNVVMYCRTSSELQADNFSIAMQKDAIKEYCNKHNYNLIGEYIDECKSGTSTNNRTDFNKMLNDIKNNSTISAVLIYRISRISRSLADTVNTIQLLDHYNVNLISTEDNINTSDMFGRTIVYILGTFAELDRNNIVSTCRSGMMQRSKEGLWNGG